VGVLLVSHLCAIVAGAAAMLGHVRPLFLKFEKGGKAVATCGGVFFGVAPLVALAAGLVWILAFLVTRYASVGSVAAAITLPVAAAAFGYPAPVIVFAGLACAAVVFLHRANLRRLRAGTENRFHFRRAARA